METVPCIFHVQLNPIITKKFIDCTGRHGCFIDHSDESIFNNCAYIFADGESKCNCLHDRTKILKKFKEDPTTWVSYAISSIEHKLPVESIFIPFIKDEITEPLDKTPCYCYVDNCGTMCYRGKRSHDIKVIMEFYNKHPWRRCADYLYYIRTHSITNSLYTLATRQMIDWMAQKIHTDSIIEHSLPKKSLVTFYTPPGDTDPVKEEIALSPPAIKKKATARRNKSKNKNVIKSTPNPISTSPFKNNMFYELL